MKRAILNSMLIMCVLVCIGCAGPQKLVYKGMTPIEVEHVLGKPDTIKNSKNSCGKDFNEEVWHYYKSKHNKANGGIFFRNQKVEYAFQRL